MGSNPVSVTQTSDITTVSTKEFLDTHATMEYRFTLKSVRDRITTYSQNVYWLSRDKVITDYVNKYLACQANVFKQTPQLIHIYKISEYLWR